MNLKEYFDTHPGFCVLSTVSGDGTINAAVYARPYVMDDGRLALVMDSHRSYANICDNPNAHLLFHEQSAGYRGVRIVMQKSGEEKNSPLLEELCRRCPEEVRAETKDRALVFFDVRELRPLVGDKDAIVRGTEPEVKESPCKCQNLSPGWFGG